MTATTGGRGAPDVIVVGGGIVGATCALELCRLGARTVLFDDGRAGQATFAGAGILSPATVVHSDPAWLALADAAGARYPELAAGLEPRSGHGSGYQRCGILQVAPGPGEVAFLRELEARAAARGSGPLEPVTPDEARSLFPGIAPAQRVVHAAAARVDGERFAAALIDTAVAAGLEIRRDQVTGVTAATTSAERASGVSTPGGEVAGGAVVLCSGAWTAGLVAGLGANLPIAPMKGQILHLEAPGIPVDAPIVQQVLGHYLVGRPGGRLACGGTLEPEAGFDTAPTLAGAVELSSACLRLAPGLAPSRFLGVRVGLRPATPDGAPVIDLLPGWDNVHVCAGHGTDGLLLGPVSGLVTVLRVTGGELPPDLAPIGWDRFGAERFAPDRADDR